MAAHDGGGSFNYPYSSTGNVNFTSLLVTTGSEDEDGCCFDWGQDEALCPDKADVRNHSTVISNPHWAGDYGACDPRSPYQFIPPGFGLSGGPGSFSVFADNHGFVNNGELGEPSYGCLSQSAFCFSPSLPGPMATTQQQYAVQMDMTGIGIPDGGARQEGFEEEGEDVEEQEGYQQQQQQHQQEVGKENGELDPQQQQQQQQPPSPEASHVFDADSPLCNDIYDFGPLIPGKATLLDPSTGLAAVVKMRARLGGKVSEEEDVLGTTAGDGGGGLLEVQDPGRRELTNHRRNLWRCGASISLPRGISYLVDEHGRHVRIDELVASISAIETIDGKQTNIIVESAKKGGGGGGGVGGVVLGSSSSPGAPASQPLDLSTRPRDGGSGPMCVAWERLKFARATANNGLRRGTQQYYHVQVSLAARVSGKEIEIAKVQSRRLVVLGRGPKNFKKSREAMQMRGQGKQSAPSSLTTSPSAAQQQENQQQQHGGGQSSGEIINRSLTDDNGSQESAEPSPKRARATSTGSSSYSGGQTAGGGESRSTGATDKDEGEGDDRCTDDNNGDEDYDDEDDYNQTGRLYEYFPIGWGEWKDPVDAIYQPHVVHHTPMPIERGSQRGKRSYCSEHS